MPDKEAQRRADEIVSARDRWQADIGAAREGSGLLEMETRHQALVTERNAILQRMREMSAQTLAGLAAKARVAVSMGVIEENLKDHGLDRHSPTHPDAFLVDEAGGVLNLVNSVPLAIETEDAARG